MLIERTPCPYDHKLTGFVACPLDIWGSFPGSIAAESQCVHSATCTSITDCGFVPEHSHTFFSQFSKFCRFTYEVLRTHAGF